jgi:N-acetylneuraminic acid mutarotase
MMRAAFAAFALLMNPAVTKTVVQDLPEKGTFEVVEAQGKIYAFKSGNDEEPLAGGEVYAYDPAAGKWEARAKMRVKRANYSLVSFEGRIFAMGGMTSPGTPSAAVEEYLPATNTWIRRKSMPTARGRMGIVIVGGRIYALGGKIGAGAVTDAVEAYDPAADAWSQRQRLSMPLMGVSAAAVGGKIYKVKGTRLEGQRYEMVLEFEEYDPGADVWTRKAAWTFEREPLETVAVGNRLFVVGGGAYTGASVRSLKEYDIAADRWVFRSDMPAGSAHTIHPSWTVMGGKIYTFGGGYRVGDGWSASDRAQRYDPATDRWEELPPLTERKIGMGVAVAGNRIYVVGGEKMGLAGQGERNPRSSAVEVYAETER